MLLSEVGSRRLLKNEPSSESMGTCTHELFREGARGNQTSRGGVGEHELEHARPRHTDTCALESVAGLAKCRMRTRRGTQDCGEQQSHSITYRVVVGIIR